MGLAKISVPEGSVVFIIEDMNERIEWFENKLKVNRTGGYAINCPVAVIIAKSPEEATAILGEIEIDEIDLFFFDHDLGGAPYTPPFSTDVAKFLAEKDPNIGRRVVIHSLNTAGVKNLQGIMPGAVKMPFGSFNIEVTQ